MTLLSHQKDFEADQHGHTLEVTLRILHSWNELEQILLEALRGHHDIVTYPKLDSVKSFKMNYRVHLYDPLYRRSKNDIL